MFFISTHSHQQAIARLSAELRGKDEQIAALRDQLEYAERSRHDIVHDVRYLISNGSNDEIDTIGHILPYLLSGRLLWGSTEICDKSLALFSFNKAKELAMKYGYRLSEHEPAMMVREMIGLAATLSITQRCKNSPCKCIPPEQ